MSENGEIIDIKASDGTIVLRFKLFQDRLMPLRATNIEERFKMLKTLEFVNGDVLIVSYPKTGMLFSRGAFGKYSAWRQNIRS